jgi:arylsulfatase A-like enzyme
VVSRIALVGWVTYDPPVTASHWCGFGAAVSLLLIAPSCPPSVRDGRVVHYDLAADAVVAEQRALAPPGGVAGAGDADSVIVLLGAPGADPHLEMGFFRPTVPQGGERFAWMRREARLSLRFPTARPRAAVIDLAPYPGEPDQAVELSLNGDPLGRFDLPARSRLRVALPSASQKPGQNHLALQFDRVAPPGNVYGRRLSAALYSVAIAPVDDTLLATLELPGASVPFGAGVEDGAPTLAQPAGTAIAYAFPAPNSAELRLTPTVPAFSGPVLASVELETRAGRTELWYGRVDPGERPRDLALPVRVPGGQELRLTLRAGAGPGWIVWKAPRVVGSGPRPQPLREEPTPEEEHRADVLRGTLAGLNVVLVVLDAAGADHFGCYGYSRSTTPETDRLASEGVLFERAYTTAVYTLAAMGSLWTSLYPDEHHRDAALPRRPLTLAELLGANGILSAGWVANGMAGPGFGLDRGFAEFHEMYREGGTGAELFSRVVPAWIAKNGGRRFFAYLHFREPHFPYDPPLPFTTRFGPDTPLPKAVRADQGWLVKVNAGKIRLSPAETDHLVRLYDGNLAFADQELGALRRALETNGLWEKTVVIVTADHGEAMLEHGYIGHNHQLYEESVHIPLLIRFPKGLGPAGTRVRTLVDLLDLAPTIADLFGLKDNGGTGTAFHGRSLLPVILGASGASAVFTRTATGERPSYSVRDTRHTFIRNTRYATQELYDRATDRGEKQDLSSARPLQAALQRQLLFRWLLGLTRGLESEDATRPGLTPAQIENLRTLGYIQ